MPTSHDEFSREAMAAAIEVGRKFLPGTPGSFAPAVGGRPLLDSMVARAIDTAAAEARAGALEEAAACAEDWADIGSGMSAAEFDRKYGGNLANDDLLEDVIRALANGDGDE